MSYCGTGYKSHDYNDDGCCERCGDYDEEFDESLNDEDEDDEEQWVGKDWNGRRSAVEIEKKWLDRAKALIRELKIVEVEEAWRIVEIIEQEKKVKPYDRDVANTVVVALRETKDEREVMAAMIEAQKKAEEEACGYCSHHADKHNYDDKLNVPCTECPDGVCHREPDEPKMGLAGLQAVARKGQRKRALRAALEEICMIPDCDGTPHP
jgi:hypothetical protein